MDNYDYSNDNYGGGYPTNDQAQQQDLIAPEDTSPPQDTSPPDTTAPAADTPPPDNFLPPVVYTETPIPPAQDETNTPPADISNTPLGQLNQTVDDFLANSTPDTASPNPFAGLGDYTPDVSPIGPSAKSTIDAIIATQNALNTGTAGSYVPFTLPSTGGPNGPGSVLSPATDTAAENAAVIVATIASPLPVLPAPVIPQPPAAMFDDVSVTDTSDAVDYSSGDNSGLDSFSNDPSFNFDSGGLVDNGDGTYFDPNTGVNVDASGNPLTDATANGFDSAATGSLVDDTAPLTPGNDYTGNFVDNGDGTYLDTSTGNVVDAYGNAVALGSIVDDGTVPTVGPTDTVGPVNMNFVVNSDGTFTNSVTGANYTDNGDGTVTDNSNGDLLYNNGDGTLTSLITGLTVNPDGTISAAGDEQPVGNTSPGATAAKAAGKSGASSGGSSGGGTSAGKSGGGGSAAKPATSGIAQKTVISDQRSGNDRIITWSDGTSKTFPNYYAAAVNAGNKAPVTSTVGQFLNDLLGTTGSVLSTVNTVNGVKKPTTVTSAYGLAGNPNLTPLSYAPKASTVAKPGLASSPVGLLVALAAGVLLLTS